MLVGATLRQHECHTAEQSNIGHNAIYFAANTYLTCDHLFDKQKNLTIKQWMRSIPIWIAFLCVITWIPRANIWIVRSTFGTRNIYCGNFAPWQRSMRSIAANSGARKDKPPFDVIYNLRRINRSAPRQLIYVLIRNYSNKFLLHIAAMHPASYA